MFIRLSHSQQIADNLPSVGDPTVLEERTWKAIAIASVIVTGLVIIVTLLMIRCVCVSVEMQ